jgi:hypothetical protein
MSSENICKNCKWYRFKGGFCIFDNSVNNDPFHSCKDYKNLFDCEVTKVCHWKKQDGHWLSKCGLEFVLSDHGAPHEHEMSYCPKCGHEIIEVDA